MRPVLAFDADVAVLLVPEVANSHLTYKETARIPLTADAEATDAAGRAAIDALVPANGGRDGSVRGSSSRWHADQVLRKTINLPAAVEENLVQVLTYDLDRHTPFKPEEVCFDAEHRRARPRQERGARRLGRGAQVGRRRVAAARGRHGARR